jgi:hypothetical protein
MKNRKEYYRQWYLKNREKILEKSATPEYLEKQKHYQRSRKERLREETQKENLIFIEENGLVEHPNYPGYYGTIDGKVFSNRGAYGKIRPIKPILQKSNNGYHLLSLGQKDDGTRIQCLHHQFIAQLFVENPNNYDEVNHIDEDKSNNHADNLEWCTRQYNVSHSVAKEYIVTDLRNNKEFTIKNLSEWCRMEDINLSYANRIANGTPGYNTIKNRTYTIRLK